MAAAASVLFGVVALLVVFVGHDSHGQCGVDASRSRTAVDVTSKRVAVIGSGIGGSSFAYWLRNKHQHKHRQPTRFEIDVFEAGDRVGGRARTVEFHGKTLEVGASVFLSANKYMSDYADMLNVSLDEPFDESPGMGLYDVRSERFVFESSEWKLVTLIKMIWRYGFSSLWDMRSSVGDKIGKWKRLYDLQEHGVAFHSVDAFLDELGLRDLTLKRFAELFPFKKLYDELVHGMTRNNYNQHIDDLPALVGFISMSPFSSGSDVLSVRGGNAKICQGLLKRSGSRTIFEKIGRVTQQEDGRWMLDGRPDRIYDIVVLAAPRAQSGVQFESLAKSGQTQVTQHTDAVSRRGDEKRKMRTTHVTLIRGIVDPEFFHMPDSGSRVPGTVLFVAPPVSSTTTAADWWASKPSLPFSSLGTWAVFPDGSRVIKLFSDQRVSDELVDRLMLSPVDHSSVYRHRWEGAYPEYSVPETPFERTELYENVYYISGIERAVSALEVSAMWGRNVALLVLQRHGESRRMKQQPDPSLGREL